jgi:peptidoglycan/LPS O-acetylase OafA/YrhL
MNRTSPIDLRTAAPDAGRGLTSLRFFPALWVVFYHSLAPMVPSVEGHRSVMHKVSLAYVLLSFFFLLSGYILAIAYLRNGQGFQKSKFYLGRFARIYPLYFITLVLDTPDWFVAHARGFGGFVPGILPTTGVFAEHLLMLQAWLPWQRGIDRPNWSLSVEAFLYLLFPFVAIRIWKLSSRAVCLLAPALWIGGQLMLLLASGYFSIDALLWVPLVHLSTFLLGIALARWQYLNEHRIQSWPNSVLSLLLAISGIALAAFIRWPDFFPRQYLNDGLFAPIWALAILVVSINDRWPAKLLGNRILRELGDGSYALYLYHLPILHLVQRLPLPRTWAVYCLYIALCVGISVASFRYYETPLRSRIVKWQFSRAQRS